jgi:putative ABC transport system permease protein
VGLIRHLNGELVIVSRTVYTLSVPYAFPFRRIEQARAFPEVTSGVAVTIQTRRSFWRNPIDRLPRRIQVVAYAPGDDALDIGELIARRDDWSRPGTAMADARSRTQRLGPLVPEMVSELSGKTVRIVGTFDLGADFQSDGTLVMSDTNLDQVFPDRRGLTRSQDEVTLGLLRSKASGTTSLRSVRSSPSES